MRRDTWTTPARRLINRHPAVFVSLVSSNARLQPIALDTSDTIVTKRSHLCASNNSKVQAMIVKPSATADDDGPATQPTHEVLVRSSTLSSSMHSLSIPDEIHLGICAHREVSSSSIEKISSGGQRHHSTSGRQYSRQSANEISQTGGTAYEELVIVDKDALKRRWLGFRIAYSHENSADESSVCFRRGAIVFVRNKLVGHDRRSVGKSIACARLYRLG